MNIENHILQGEGVTFQATPNVGSAFGADLPDSIVIHYTAGGSLEGSVSWLINPDARASAHVVIGRDGRIVQLAPFNIVTWHAGRSTWKGRSGYNQFSIGIELDNAGSLTKQDGVYKTSFGRTISNEDVIKSTHRNETTPRYWHNYTEAQLTRTKELCAKLMASYGIKAILGHEEISPGRKTDPGPAFPLDNLRDALIDNPGNEDGAEEAYPIPGSVSAKTSLNIRKGPGSNFATVADPLQRGKHVTVLEEKNGWLRVSTTVEGWVSKDFIKKTTS